MCRVHSAKINCYNCFTLQLLYRYFTENIEFLNILYYLFRDCRRMDNERNIYTLFQKNQVDKIFM